MLRVAHSLVADVEDDALRDVCTCAILVVDCGPHFVGPECKICVGWKKGGCWETPGRGKGGKQTGKHNWIPRTRSLNGGGVEWSGVGCETHHLQTF
jgi:hypothetical protein